MPIFQGLGRALRWLRERQTKRQYQVADAAGITKAMLSAYETGKQKPSLDTLEKILAALEGDLNDLHNALQIVNERPEAIRRAGRDASEGEAPGASRSEVYRVLGIDRQLPAPEEQALAEMLDGFHKLVRYFHHSHLGASPPPPSSPPSAED
jgi:transcriptional regulator with XRE-family HTH domain